MTIQLLLLCIAASASFSDSLWDPASPGLITGAGGLGAGDTVLISIDINQDLVYDSSRIDSERVSIELTGGEGQGLFSFLPAGSSSGNQSLKGSESLSFETSFAVSITGIDGSGRFILSGGRTVIIQGKRSTVTLTGTADPSLIGEDRILPFSSIVDARIVYDTFLTTGGSTVRPADIREVAVGTGASGQTVGAAVPEGEAMVPETPTATTPALTEEKKRELLLLYLNRLIDTVFE